MMNGLFILICCFSSSIAAIFAYATGLEEGLVLRVCCVFTFVYSLFCFFDTFNTPINGKAMNVFWGAFFTAFVIMGSFFVTELRYGYSHDLIGSTVMSFGSKPMAALFFALAWLKKDYLDSVVRWIIPFVFASTVIMFISVIKQVDLSYLRLDINYQKLSYAASFSIGLLLFFIKDILTFGKKVKKIQTITILLAVLLIFLNLFILFFGGGKGALVLLGVLLFFNIVQIDSKKIRLILFVFFCLIALVVLAYTDELSSFSGFKRILSTINASDIGYITSGRDVVYEQAIQSIINNVFVSFGAGSVFYEVGYYAHNLFLDILVDWGFVGLVFSILIFLLILRNLWQYRKDRKCSFLLLLFVMSFIMLMFSSTFYINFGIWFSSIAILGYEKNESRRSIIQSKS